MPTLLFYKGRRSENPSATFWDNFICLVTRSRYSHVELAFFNIDANHLCWSSSTRDDGVRYKRIYVDYSKWDAVSIQLDKDDSFFLQHEGKGYDYMGLIGTVIALPIFSRKNKWFCSEIIAAFFGLSNPWSYTPEDLYKYFNTGVSNANIDN